MPEVGALPDGGGGMARVVLATDVPSRVERVTHRVARIDRETAPVSTLGGEGLLCAETPCVVTLPYGDHELVFKGTRDHERGSSTMLAVRRPTVVLNHTLGRVHVPRGQTVGWILALSGGLLLGVGLGLAANDQNRRGVFEPTASSLALAGLGTITLGGIVSLIFPSTKQEGASTQWSPPGSSAAAAGGIRF